MSAFNFIFVDEFVAIAMDSQASRDDGNRHDQPFGFFTKIFPLPHVNGVLCGTGNQGVVLDWFVQVETQIIARDVVFLDQIAPKLLPDIAGKHQPGDTTIYHFGFDLSGTLRGYAYRSSKNFASDPLAKGFGIKPPSAELVAWFPEAATQQGIPAAFVELIRRQRLAEEAKPPEQRVGIGGEVHFFYMAPGQGQSMWTCYRFDDFEAEYEKVVAWLGSHSDPSRGQTA